MVCNFLTGVQDLFLPPHSRGFLSIRAGHIAFGNNYGVM